MLRHDLTYRLEQGWHAAFASPSNLCSSLPPGAFGALRLFFFLFWLSVTIWAVADDFDAQFWIYLTNWSLLFELTYFAFAAGLAMAAIFFNVPDAKGEKTPWYARVGYALQCSTYVISFIVSVLFWALVYDGGALPAISFFTHGSNFIVAFADLLLAGIPFRVGHVSDSFCLSRFSRPSITHAPAVADVGLAGVRAGVCVVQPHLRCVRWHGRR